MWYKAYSTAAPVLLDTTSSKKYVYVRKNVTEYTTEDEMTGYEYDEMKIPKEVYGIFEQNILSESRIADIEDAIAEIIGGGLYE